MSRLIKEFKDIEGDQAKWLWLINNQGVGLVVMCDNDETMLIDENNEDEYARFDNYIGWSDGVIDLLNAIGIECDCV